MKNKTVCIVGLGYVGLPLADAFSKHLRVIGFDVDNEKIRLLKRNKENIEFPTDPSKIKLIEKDGWYLKQAGLKEVKEDG